MAFGFWEINILMAFGLGDGVTPPYLGTIPNDRIEATHTPISSTPLFACYYSVNAPVSGEQGNPHTPMEHR